MESRILLQQLLMPAIVSLLGCYLLATTDQGEDVYEDETVQGIWFRLVFGTLLCGLSMIVSDLWTRELLFKFEEWPRWHAKYQWECMVWSVPGAMFLMAVAKSIYSIPNRYIAVGSTLSILIGCYILFSSLNESDSWNEQSKEVLPWMAIGMVAIAANVSSLNSIARSDGARWMPLVILAQLGCISALALQSYGSLGQWALTGCGVALGASIVSLWKGSTSKSEFGWYLSPVLVPLGVMACSVLVVSRFFASVAMPQWLLGATLFLPTLVGMVDCLLGRISGAWMRAIWAAVVCSAVLGAILYYSFPSKPEW